jgi:Immunoglobulin-like domain of bacterial spore germination
MKYLMFGLIALAVLAGVLSTLIRNGSTGEACPVEAQLCPNGSFVGRSGPHCEFQCPAVATATDETLAHVESKRDLITLATPVPGAVITSPIVITGQARGSWYFEASFPIVLTNWDGLIIAETAASAQTDWMTEDFVSFRAELGFESPYKNSNPDFMKRGTLILHKSNASGEQERDDALEIPIEFSPLPESK